MNFSYKLDIGTKAEKVQRATKGQLLPGERQEKVGWSERHDPPDQSPERKHQRELEEAL